MKCGQAYNSSNERTQSCCSPSILLNPNQKMETGRFNPLVAADMAEKLNTLSPSEREHIMEEIHGVTNELEEVPEFVAEKLGSLEEELRKICGKLRAGYDLAMSMDQTYVQNRDFRLKFLRSDDFVEKKTALKLMKYFNVKLQLFGEQKLVKDITFDDLNINDQATLCCGSHQFAGCRDVKGRNILFCFPDLIEAVSWENFARARWYQLMVSAEDEVSTRRGTVIVYVAGTSNRSLGITTKAYKLLTNTLPFRLVAVHACFINQHMPIVIKLLLDVMDDRFAVRFRAHLTENVMTCLYSLLSFGIDPKSVPLDEDGKPTITNFLKHLELQKNLERQSHNHRLSLTAIDKSSSSANECLQSSSIVPDIVLPDIEKTTTNEGMTNQDIHMTVTNVPSDVVVDKTPPPPIPSSSSSSGNAIMPKPRDVLLGRGKRANCNLGNTALDKLIDDSLNAHQRAVSRFDKTCVVLATLRLVQSSGGRFLQFDNKRKEWFIVTDTEAHNAVSKRFRNKARRITLAAAKN